MGKKLWISGLVLLGLGAGVVATLATRRHQEGPSWRTEAVTRGDVRVQVSATGTLNAVTTVTVGSQVSGTIAALYTDFNGRVHRGQVLGQLDPTFLKAQVAESRANLERVMVQLRQAVRDSTRVFSLGGQGLASQVEQDQAQTAVESARAQVGSASAALERAETNLRYATITCPIDGVVVSRNVDVGQTVAASLSAPTLFTIAEDLTRMQLEASVDEADIGQVHEGQRATFTVDAYPQSTFEGIVHQVRLAPETVQNVVTYTVIILVDNPDQKLLPGMTANVTVQVDAARDALKVPSTALRFRPEETNARRGGAEAREGRMGGMGGNHDAGARKNTQATSRGGVYLVERGQLRRVRVELGLSDGTFTAVTSDSLREGDLVVLGKGVAESGSNTQNVVNPFAPRMPGQRSGGGATGRGTAGGR